VVRSLNHGEDVPFAVLAPRGLAAASGHKAVDGLEAGHLVFLEDHALRSQFGDFGLHVGDLPEGLAAFDVPAPADGYRKIHERFPHS
jgi:hypothetical protein